MVKNNYSNDLIQQEDYRKNYTFQYLFSQNSKNKQYLRSLLLQQDRAEPNRKRNNQTGRESFGYNSLAELRHGFILVTDH